MIPAPTGDLEETRKQLIGETRAAAHAAGQPARYD
jgi:hypothetical protein